MVEVTSGHKQLDRWLAAQGKGAIARLATGCGCSRAAVHHWVVKRHRPTDALRPILRVLTGIPEDSWRLRSEAKAIKAALVGCDVGATAQS